MAKKAPTNPCEARRVFDGDGYYWEILLVGNESIGDRLATLLQGRNSKGVVAVWVAIDESRIRRAVHRAYI